ncbi:SAM-dependent methyltransferase [Sphaerisporangium corydalis]|uniref:SAM-dependent methyltransferase n=1 Tax=Sphaerisporangium corydalis TaxID=1441875 RepID=A0ABV9EFX7_9ACTN|nr:SAM-dependent methyltransferase [Sphaerisporangium corydalis]
MNPASNGGVFDPSTPNAARMYDYFLGGKDNLPVDRAAAEQVLKLVPEIPVGIRENRAFLCRAVRFLAEQGVRQFLDIGAGLPTQRNVHQVAAEYAPGSRTVYVDNDPQVLTHARALLQDSPQVLVAEGDLRRPEEILHDHEVRAHLDFDRPIAVLLLAIVHFIPDAEDPRGIVARLRDGLAPGSHLALSHVAVDERPQAAPAVERVYNRASAQFVARMSGEIAPFFDGLDLAEPGMVNLHEWRPDIPVVAPVLETVGSYFLCGVGRVR